MQTKNLSGIQNVIKVWPLKDVKKGVDVFGECIIEEYLEDTIPGHTGKEIPEGQFNLKMEKELIAVSEGYHLGIMNLEAAANQAVTVILDPTNYA